MTSQSEIQGHNLEQYAASIVYNVLKVLPMRIKQINRGVMTFKFAAELPTGESFIIRFYPDTRWNIVNYEPDILQRCSELGLPVPKVVIDSRTGPEAPLQYMVYRMIDGFPLSDRYTALTDASRLEIAAQIVAHIHSLHQVHLSGFGDLIDGSTAKFDSWRVFMQQSISDGISSARQNYVFNDDVITKLEAVALDLGAWSVQPGCGLTGWDISPENILVDNNNRIVGLLDFEGILSGDILLNLGYCYARYYKTAFFESVADAWPCQLTDHQWRDVELYAVIRALRIARFAHQPLPTGHTRTPVEDFLPGFKSALNSLVNEGLKTKKGGYVNEYQ